MKNTEKNYDLDLGTWGPYNKKYLGVCHIDNEKTGSAFCVELFPGYYRRSVIVSPTVCDGAVKMWGANAHLTAFCYRYELEWKDRVYCDVHFNISGDDRVDIDCEFVNNTDVMQNLSMNLCAGIRTPSNIAVKCDISANGVLIDAVDYNDISGAFGIASDGRYLAETEAEGASGYGTVVECRKGTAFRYKTVRDINSIGVRFSAAVGGNVFASVHGRVYTLTADDGGFIYRVIKFSECYVDEIELSADCDAYIDCIAVGLDVEKCSFEVHEVKYEPAERIVNENGIHLKYANSEYEYDICWDNAPIAIRRLFADDEGLLLQKYMHNHVSTRFRAENDNGAWENVFAPPVYLAPHETRHIKFVVKSRKIGASENVSVASKPIYRVLCNPDGKKYEFSQNIMAYTTMLNVVYPIYSRRGFIRHNTPGRNWNSLYSWDSGFIGMGLATIDFERAFDCLNAYLTPVGDIHSPYIFHGSVVPTQVFLYAELIDRFPHKSEQLKAIYPMMLQYYSFYSLLCDDGNQTGSGLLKTWHIFYNSGGWDDYPPQTAVHSNSRKGLKGNTTDTTPVITTACVVLIAKIMKRLAIKFGIDETELFDDDIKKYSSVIQTNLWDDEVGYYSYLIHDENGVPSEFLRYDDGTNYNCGFDGIYPLIAGICNDYQKNRILENIKKGLMTKYGVGAVDTRAPYYSDCGYWNGSVWMPHQWILWKSLFDGGCVELIEEIARKAVEVWSNEVCDSYSCFENFMASSGRGSGYHAFSGLSTPVLLFYEALYSPGTVTAGFFTSVVTKSFSDDNTTFNSNINSANENSVIIVCMNSEYDYDFYAGGKLTESRRITEGAYFVKMQKSGRTVICADKKQNKHE